MSHFLTTRVQGHLRLSYGLLLLLVLLLVGCRASTSPATPITIATTAAATPLLVPTARPILTPLPTSNVIPTSATPDCLPLGVPSTLPFPGKAGQVWYADQIAVGKVIAQETRWEGDRNYQVITTYSLFRVEERIRGLPLGELLIEQRGGTIGGCTQRNSEQPLPQGEDLLLFLHLSDTPESRSGPPIYYIMFDDYDIYRLAGDITNTQQASITAEARQILSQPPPKELSAYWTVPLDHAPLAPPPTATPQR